MTTMPTRREWCGPWIYRGHGFYIREYRRAGVVRVWGFRSFERGASGS